MNNELISLSYSPWSEKARWALDHRRIPYRRVPYQPMIGEPALRLRMRKLTGPLSVPVLFDGYRWYDGSWAIARFAETTGKGEPLFPDGTLDDIAGWDATSERALAAGRALGLPRILDDREALTELVPPPLRRALGPLAVPTAAFGIRRTMRKYGTTRQSDREHDRVLHDALTRIRDHLQPTEGGGPETLLGRFTYADVTAAQIIQFVEPESIGKFRIAASSARAYRHDAYAREFADLAQWRDALYAQYR